MRFSPTILTAVMSYMTHRPDILSVMYTSKTLYGAGIPYLLRPCLGFEEERKLSSFCDFILADAPARAKHIRHLRFDFGLDEDDHKLAKKLARVLGQATRLETLEFNWEDSTELNERLVQAFAQLKSVKALIIHEADDAILNMIKQMQSPVEDVYLNAESVNLDDFSVLSSFQSSLRRLSLRAVSSPHHKPGITFPKMRALFVMLWNNMDMEGFIRAFPNLRKLSMHLQDYDDQRLDEDREEYIRESNEEVQERVRWKHLEQVSADAFDLYISCLRANVDTIDFRLSGAHERGYVTEILQGYTHPTRLNFCYDTYCDDETARVQEHLTGLLYAAAFYVTHLYLYIRPMDDPEQFLDFLCQEVATLYKLVGVSLKLSLTEKGQEVLARRLAAAAPALQNIVLGLSPSDRSYWQVEKAKGNKEATVKRLTEKEAEILGIVVDPSFDTFDGDYPFDGLGAIREYWHNDGWAEIL